MLCYYFNLRSSNERGGKTQAMLSETRSETFLEAYVAVGC
jgi:hypothetical protein